MDSQHFETVAKAGRDATISDALTLAEAANVDVFHIDGAFMVALGALADMGRVEYRGCMVARAPVSATSDLVTWLVTRSGQGLATADNAVAALLEAESMAQRAEREARLRNYDANVGAF